MNLRVEIYSDTVVVLSKLKEKGDVIATLTDLSRRCRMKFLIAFV